MNSLLHAGSIVCQLCLLCTALYLTSNQSWAQSLAVGTIEGRVLNTDTGRFLEKARITIEGTRIETLTDSAGEYRIANAPAGPARVQAFHTAVVVQTQTITVEAGRIVRLDFDLARFQAKSKDVGRIKLDRFVVSSTMMDGAAIAINEQRFAPNAVLVVTADEFGAVADGGVGELLKSLPGVSLDSQGGFGDAYTISMNGVPAGNVPVTVGGFDLPSASVGTARTVGLQQISITNYSRVEVTYTPTPETTGSALAGSVNMVPHGAFEHSRPVFNTRVSVMMRDNDRSFHKTPGPGRTPTRKVHPGFDFSAIVPVNKRFGFTVSGSISTLSTWADQSRNTWQGAGAPTNGTTFPDTTPDKPYLTSYAVREGPTQSMRDTLGATIDYKVGPNDRLSFSVQHGQSDSLQFYRTLTFLVNRVLPADFTTTSTRGFPGAGEVRLNNNVTSWGGTVLTPSLTYRHNGPVWRSEAGAGYSRSTRHINAFARGFFQASQARRQGVTVSFDDIFYLRPSIITVTDGATGAPIDPYNIGTYTLNTAGDNTEHSLNEHRKAYANLQREFHGRVPVALKAGLDIRHTLRDIRADGPSFTFVGRDLRAGSIDDGAAAVFDESFSRHTAPFGFPRIQWVSNEALLDVYNTNPNYFTTNAATTYTTAVARSQHAEEVISSGFIRGDLHLLDRRLKLVGGLRAEQTNVKGEGRLVDPTQNYQRDPAGNVIRGAGGAPLTITSDPLATVRLTNLDRGLQARKEYLRWFPSLNGSYSLNDSLVARAGYYWSVGRPDFNQYAGGVSLPNTENPPGPNNRMSVNNAGIKAWSARTTRLSLEYYFQRVGLVSVSAFNRTITNFFASTVFMPSPQFLDLYALDPDVYGDYEVMTQENLPTSVRMTGFDFNYKQALMFLPHWARGVKVFANASTLRATGAASANFSGFLPFSGNWGVSLSRPAYSFRVNWNYTGRQRRTQVANGRSIESGTYNWGSKRLLVDVNAEYFFSKQFAVYTNLSNILDAPADIEIAGPGTPAHAQFWRRTQFGAQWTFGIKGSF